MRLMASVDQAEKSVKSYAERGTRLEKELESLRRHGAEVEPKEIELLTKINTDVTQLTVTNRQLETKCVLL